MFVTENCEEIQKVCAREHADVWQAVKGLA